MNPSFAWIEINFSGGKLIMPLASSANNICICSGTLVSAVRGMIDAPVQCSSVQSVPDKLGYVLNNGNMRNAKELLGAIKPFVGIDTNGIAKKDIKNMEPLAIIDGLIELNTKTFNCWNGNAANLDKKTSLV